LFELFDRSKLFAIADCCVLVFSDYPVEVKVLLGQDLCVVLLCFLVGRKKEWWSVWYRLFLAIDSRYSAGKPWGRYEFVVGGLDLVDENAVDRWKVLTKDRLIALVVVGNAL
jgi:hypothetical protein